MFWRSLSIFLMLTLAAPSAVAQSRAETLADIRQDLSFLHVEIQRLKQELSTTGTSDVSTSGTQLQRLDTLEGELRRITGKVEELEFRIDRIVQDGTNRIGDLEFRLVELEGGDISTLGATSTLGGDVDTNTVAVVTPPNTTTELAASEEIDFANAKDSFDQGDFQRSGDLFVAFVENYPGGPLTAKAQFWLGESLAAQDDWSGAATAFLQSFSSSPDADPGARALFRLGISLDRIGKTSEGCIMLDQVDALFPGTPEAFDAKAQMLALNCPT